MKLLLLSKRHRRAGATCDVCGKWRTMQATARFVQAGQEDTSVNSVDICVPCLRAALEVAQAGRKTVRP